MPEIGTFDKGDRVFVAQLSSGNWPGLEIVESNEDTVQVKMVYTNGIPGYELGQILFLPADAPAYRELTVDAVIQARDSVTNTDKQNNEPAEIPECVREECDGSVVARLVYHSQGPHFSDYLCEAHATCTGECDAIVTIMDAEYDEPWCERHANQFSPATKLFPARKLCCSTPTATANCSPRRVRGDQRLTTEKRDPLLEPACPC